MSTNRSPMTSRYTRKENYESLNLANTLQNVSPYRPYNTSANASQEQSALKKSIQQKQIEDLQQKVDLILEHNDKLVTQNEVLKKRLTQAEVIGHSQIQRQRISRYKMAQEGQLYIQKLNGDLLYKKKEVQDLTISFQSYKQHSRKEIQSLNQLISQLNINSQTIKSQNAKLSQELFRVREEFQQQSRMAARQAQRKLQDQINKLMRQNGDAISRQKEYQDKIAAQLAQKFEDERNEWQNRKNILITKLQDTHNQEINELREQLLNDFNKQTRKLSQQAEDKCRNQRQKADKFVKDFIENLGPSNDSQMDLLRHQIKMLQESLASRKKFIDQLTSDQVHRQDLRTNISQAILMKDRLKDQLKHLMRQNQLLKVKQGQKYEKDLKQMVKIYEDKIDVLSSQVRDLSNQNDRLRHNYQDEVTVRIKQRRQFQIQISQLKNIIRKLKVQIQGIQDQFKMNIEGMSMQSQTFSMHMMKSVAQIKQKSNFHEQENRKLRMMYQKHEKQVDKQKKQAQQKVQYYSDKVDHLNKLLESQRRDLQEKQQILMNKIQERQQNLRETVRQERQHMRQMMAISQEQRSKLQRQLIDCKQKLYENQLELKDAKVQIQRLRSKLKENDEHIERLRMELQMAGVNDGVQNDTLNNWKEHYEGIIQKLEEDKRELKGIIDGNNKKFQQLIYKYKLLEQELKKTAISLSKRGQLDKKIIQLGMDENLVKNMSEMWTRKSMNRQQS